MRPLRAGGGKSNRERSLLGRALDPLDPRHRLQLALRLAGLRPVAEPVDEPLEVRQLLLLALERACLGGDPLGLHAAPVRVGALLVAPAPAVDLEHAGRHRFEEPAVVRHEHHSGVEPGEVVLEPLDGVGVEVVGRLVEEQDVRLGRQGAHQRRPCQLAARERAQRPVEVGRREAEPARHGLEPGPPRVAARPLELALGGVVAAQDGVGGMLGHPRLELAQLGLELLRLRGPGADVRPERVGPGERRALVVQRHARARRHRDVAPVGCRARRRAGAGASSCRRRFGRRAQRGRGGG